ncbi:MAG TPA: hypothetical protein VMU77_07290 [Acidimicrobiales bacterium]|nr:hypothetical protein [Acidimicrobiales bacterium]
MIISIVCTSIFLGSAVVAPVGASAPASPHTLNLPTPSAPSPVPASYQSNYQTLSTDISYLATQDNAGSVDPNSGGTTVGGELKVADGNFGTVLLAPGYMSTVDDELSNLSEMGVKTVVVDVAFPLLLPSFQNSSQYLSFYE